MKFKKNQTDSNTNEVVTPDAKNGGKGRWLIIIAVLIISGALSSFYALSEYTSATAALIKAADANSDRFEEIYIDAAARRTSKLRFGADMLLQSGEIVSAFSKDDRAALSDKVLPLYEGIFKKKHDVDRVNFWSPPATSFFRAHEPKVFGVDSSDSRLIVVEATKNRNDVFGLEVGINGVIALRAIVPVVDGNRFVGVIELGSELNSLLQRAAKTTGMDFAVGMDVKRSEGVKRPVDAKNDSVQGSDVFYLYSKPEVGKTLRSISFNSRSTKPQIIKSGGNTIFVSAFTIKDFTGSPSVVVATVLDLTKDFAAIFRSVLIKGVIAFLVITVIAIVAVFKFRELRDGFTRAI